ncbi:MAG: alpha/beta hydrolase [Spirochaetes bacterium]|nr:alpha/beta hydrolase [Spirochaetota bacterium]MBN2771227.1 alpha/beta hydrolase [Spirochaetota bacterium]
MKDLHITLSDGRKLAFIEIGDPQGVPVFFFHGTPGSRKCLKEDATAFIQNGIRIIAADRPGMGMSDPQAKRSFKGWAGDVRELADYLGIERYHVAGGSGGGPHALACGIYTSARVLSVTLISSAAPPDVPGLSKGMSKGNRLGFFAARYLPFLLRMGFKSYAKLVKKNPDALIHSIKKQLCPWDRAVFEKADSEAVMEKAFIDELGEAFRQNPLYAAEDFLLVARPWNFDFTQLDMPVFLWHGEADTLMPAEPVRQLVKMIPGCDAAFIPEAGHLLLESEDVGKQILQKIIGLNV